MQKNEAVAFQRALDGRSKSDKFFSVLIISSFLTRFPTLLSEIYPQNHDRASNVLYSWLKALTIYFLTSSMYIDK